jgi:aminopeptidase-like protein|tara:strand:- start:657 stop:1937 length:1281 start_codon:yes stop_codon:yes gene_type:complete
MNINNKILKTCIKLIPIYRSITGSGNLKTLRILKKINTDLKVLKFKSGNKVYDWRVPKVWEIYDAWIKDEKNFKIIDFKKNFLHVVGYSVKINKNLHYKKLLKNIYTLKNQPNLIPYVTSYYKKVWGFCMSETQKKKITKGNFQVFINSKLKDGSLNVGEIYIPGRLKKEILLTTYICHPQMLNNEISGPSVLIHLSNWIKKIKNRKYSYRILFSSETIGTICYIKKRYKVLKTNVIGGYVISCVGDDRNFSYIKSKEDNSLSNQIALRNFKKIKDRKKIFSWLNRGSDERQFNSPGINLGIGGICRSKYGEYPEYHTSGDLLGNVVTKKGLNSSYNFFTKVILDFEKAIIPITKIKCEPFLTKYNLISTLSKKNEKAYNVGNILNLISFCDGSRTIETISKLINLDLKNAKKILIILKKNKIVEY